MELITQFCSDHLGQLGSCLEKMRAHRRERQVMLFADEVRRQQVLGHGLEELEADKEELRRREGARAELDRQLLGADVDVEQDAKSAITRRRSSILSVMLDDPEKPYSNDVNAKKVFAMETETEWDQWDAACRTETTLNPHLHEDPELPSPSHYVPLEDTHRELEYVSSRFIEHVIHSCNERAYERASHRSTNLSVPPN